MGSKSFLVLVMMFSAVLSEAKSIQCSTVNKDVSVETSQLEIVKQEGLRLELRPDRKTVTLISSSEEVFQLPAAWSVRSNLFPEGVLNSVKLGLPSVWNEETLESKKVAGDVAELFYFPMSDSKKEVIAITGSGKIQARLFGKDWNYFLLNQAENTLWTNFTVIVPVDYQTRSFFSAAALASGVSLSGLRWKGWTMECRQ